MPEEKAPELLLSKLYSIWIITDTNRKDLLHKCLNHLLFRPFKFFLRYSSKFWILLQEQNQENSLYPCVEAAKVLTQAPDPFCLPKDHRLDQESLISTCSRLLMLPLGLLSVWHSWTSLATPTMAARKFGRDRNFPVQPPGKMEPLTQLLPPLLDGMCQLPKANVNI